MLPNAQWLYRPTTLQPHFVGSLLGPCSLVTPPEAGLLPISLPEAKDQCRSTLDDDNAYIMRLISVATRMIQRKSNRQILTATYNLPVRDWWGTGALKLPKPPLQSVVSITYLDPTATLQTLNPECYEVTIPDAQPGYITHAPEGQWMGVWWPYLLRPYEFPISIQFTCGYASPQAIPETIRHAIAMLVDYLWTHRGEEEGPMPRAIDDLLDAEGWGSYA